MLFQAGNIRLTVGPPTHPHRPPPSAVQASVTAANITAINERLLTAEQNISKLTDRTRGCIQMCEDLALGVAALENRYHKCDQMCKDLAARVVELENWQTQTQETAEPALHYPGPKAEEPALLYP
jgi:hypothetical protein